MLYQTHVRIHLGNIRANLRGIRQRIGGERKLLISIKANAYGHGALEIARMAQDEGLADWLGVATLPEALLLREAGIRLPILKLTPTFPEEMTEAVKGAVTLSVCDEENLAALEATAKALGTTARVHLKVDTGMGRIGVPEAGAPLMARSIEGASHLHLEGIFTHLPVSDEPQQDADTLAQVERFKDTVKRVESAIDRPLELVHCSNSGGVLGHDYAWLNMVRPGVIVYGYYPDATTPKTIALRPGLSFLSRISFIKKVAPGTAIGYGHTWTAPRETWIATIPVGYADGFNRLFSNTGRVLIAGQSCPVVGRVCMDQIMVDLGPESTVKVGEEAVLIGRSGDQEITADEWAKKLGTITYEITCQIASRVTRIYDPS
ncbi:MAG: alr [Holophagaceae bacterium]|nr:alr [Holophagaceae bacterium]